MKIYEIRDPVYGFIEFNDWEREIINHPVFQRLRRIRQLGLTDMIYPGAMHTRFEHSIGVMHLATKMYDAIISKEQNLRILKDYLNYDEAGLKRDRQVVRLAALLHDVGHAPFSHASEDSMPLIEGTEKHYKHEDYTSAIIKGPLKDVIEKHPLNENYRISAEEVAGLLEGKAGRVSFWKVLISSQLDADRGDYLLRDSLHIGVKYGVYDVDRLLVTLTLGIDPETKEDVILGVSKGGWHVAESLIIARYQMFTQVYYHKTRRAYDFMLKEAIKETIGTFPSPDNIEHYLEYDDFYLWKIMEKENSEWFEYLKNRLHIRAIYETKELPNEEEKKYINALKTKLKESKIWFWEDSPEKAKSWYDITEENEIMIIDEDSILPLSSFSKIVNSLQSQFAKMRVYVKYNDKEKANKVKKEVIR